MTENEIKKTESLDLETPELLDAAYDHGDEWAFGDDVKFVIKDITSHAQAQTCQMTHKETKSGCTIIGALNQLIKLFNLNLNSKESDELGLEVVKFATQYGYKIGQGRSTPTAMNTVLKWWNDEGRIRFGKEKAFYVRIDRKDPRVAEALEKGHYVGFTYQLKFGVDTYWGLVDKDDYPAGIGHRTNFQRKEDVNTASKKVYTDVQLGVHDNYYGRVNEYYIKDVEKYMNRGMRTAVYLVMPESWKEGVTVETTKEEIAGLKAANAVIGALSSTYKYMPEDIKNLFANLAKTLRTRFPGAREPIDDQNKKEYQFVADTLSFAWKSADEKHKEVYALLAKSLREKEGVL